jgi:hypothetical protein
MQRILALAAMLLAGTTGWLVREPADRAAAAVPILATELRKPGFVFVELVVHDLDKYIPFLEQTAGFKIERREKDFAILQTTSGEILLSRVLNAPGKLRGGLELGICVADVDASFAVAEKFTEWKVADKPRNQGWGERDFRMFAPDGYYLRFTGPIKKRT